MSLADIEPLHIETFSLQPTGPNGVQMKGTLTLRDPHQRVQPYLKRVHETAVRSGLREVRVDLTELTFVNSSAIRLFIDWTVWLQKEPKRYRLVFFTDSRITWQRTSFGALQSMAGDVIEVRRG